MAPNWRKNSSKDQIKLSQMRNIYSSAVYWWFDSYWTLWSGVAKWFLVQHLNHRNTLIFKQCLWDETENESDYRSMKLGGKNDVPCIWNPKKVSQHLMHWEKLFVVGPFSSMYQMKQLLTAIFLKWTNISQHIRWIETKKALGSDSSYSTHFLSCFKLVNCIYAYFSTHFCWEKFFDEYKKINKKK